MSKFLHRYSEGWQFARDTVFNRLASDIHASVAKRKMMKNTVDELPENILSDEKFKQYENALIRDQLTGFYNTKFFSQKLGKELVRGKRYKRPFSLMLVSIDRLGQLQKLYGDALAYQILQQEAKTIASLIRATDIPFRIRSEEFAIIFPETSSSQAIIVGQRICDKTHSRSVTSGTNTAIVTTSIGISSFPTHARQEKELLLIAMRFLQEAQKSGGNKVCNG